MFRGRKVGAARRFGKTTLLAICVLALVLAARSSGAETRAPAAGPGPVNTKTVVPVNQSDRLPKGRRAYSIVPDNSNALMPSVSPGQRIDVTAAFPAGPDGLPLAVTVLRSILVIGRKSVAGSTALVLSVTPDDVEKLTFAIANARIFVSLCPEGPDTAAPTRGVTFDDF